VKDTPTGAMIRCASAAFSGALKNGGGHSGTGIGSITTGSSMCCDAVIDGTSATADNGRVALRYPDGTGRLTVLAAGGNLHFHDVSVGCVGLVRSGDSATLSAAFTVSPKQVITSP
jgi:hypothetical protein